MESLWHDVRLALRSLLASPSTTVVALLALALGIGANTALFSVIRGVLLEPLPYPQPERLVTVAESNPERGFPVFSTSPPNYVDWRDQAKSFSALAAVNTERLNLTGEGEPEVIAAARVSAEFWQVMGVRFHHGRPFGRDEDAVGKGQVAVLSQGLWERRFGADPAVIGKTVQLDGVSHLVVGVAPAGFRFPSERDLWRPLALDVAQESRGAHYYSVFGRLRDGVPLARAQAEMKTLAANLARRYPDTNTGWTTVVTPLQEVMVRDVKPALLVLLAAVGAVLLIACLNVANLLLARLATRERELALRTALGAGRWRLARQLLTESVVLSLAGGALGVLLAAAGTRALVALYPRLPRAESIDLDPWVLAFTAGVSLLTGLLCGLLPVLHPRDEKLHDALREGGRAVAGGLRGKRARQGLVLAEVALALVLLIGAGLLIRSFSRLHAVDAGFRPQGVLALDVVLPELRYSKPEQQAALFEQLLQRVEGLPGVEEAGTVFPLPLDRSGFILQYRVEGRPEPAPDLVPSANIRAVSPDLFRTLSVPLLGGRGFNAADRVGSQPVALVNRAMAEREWPGSDPVRNALGKRLTFGDPADPEAEWMTVVGVVGNLRARSLSDEPTAEIYQSQLQSPITPSTLVVRTTKDPVSLVAPVRAIVRGLDRDLPVDRVRTLDQVVADSLAGNRFSTVLLGIFAALALLLAAVGIYGTISYSVTQRGHEIGVRMALGAGRGEVLGMILRQGMAVVLAGTVLGLAGAFFFSKSLAGLIYGVGTRDPLTFAAVPVALLTVALLANLLPARRATRVDPQVALRRE